ncbi:dihydroneopterin aldolase [Labrys monachus]|uniref:7,8-dihydroneopterin aldolase n=2 Tax=Labrys monachus TaxID=217067 RepID=A0ABU0FMJ8_9HYPH|nr:dihydroneopterin aldolase [Labrys monachus]
MTEIAPLRTSSRVFLRALQLDAHIGYYAHEKGVRQPLVADVELTLGVHGFGGDDIHGTVDYGRIAEAAHALADEHVDLIETFAERLAQKCLALPLVSAVKVRIEKPRAVPGAMAGVEIVRVKG